MEHPRLENWAVVSHSDPYTPPEHRKQYLHGMVTGYPGKPEPHIITTSRIVAVDAELELAQCKSRVYSLGAVDPEWEKLFPDAAARFFASWPSESLAR